ncbi:MULTISPECIES: hypothetical protein [Streptomyces]|uniref:Uncharacterized protein n=1 Tax=Streptomyces salyersiae TaxID=3075530 RepID=A0ABU2RJ50_9ACTN|nr:MULTISPECIES: hypothetical protein [unclassified Streptomyces]MDT0428876.1 hypothetical protein [Streptomyces sp. DSM 41770]MYU33660.1 hypothetical protein [Streptomyces sp. SID8358]
MSDLLAATHRIGRKVRLGAARHLRVMPVAVPHRLAPTGQAAVVRPAQEH